MLLLILTAVLLLVLLVLLIRAVRFVPEEETAVPAEPIPIDDAAATEHLRALIRCRTVSLPEFREEAEFQKLRDLLPVLYPKVFAACTVERVDDTGLLLRWPGKTAEEPAVFLSHYDVVPADGAVWSHPPFAAEVADGVLYGRGALDMKNQLCATLEAMEYLLGTGFTPRHDIYLALSGEEEIMGPTAAHIRDLFRQRNITPGFVLDEGGDVVEDFFPALSAPCAMVGVGEKGVANLDFTLRGPGGHASTPSPADPLPRLCRAMARIGPEPFSRRTTPALERMVDALGRQCGLGTRLLLANRDLLRPLYFRWLKKRGGLLYAGCRSTFALTMAKGSDMGNVIPPEAAMFANLRLLYGDSTDSAIKTLRRKMKDPDIEITRRTCAEPRPDSLCTTGWAELSRAIRATFPEAVVTPYLMVATTDSRHYRDICPNVYRFSGKQVSGAEKASVHGVDERIRVENTGRAARFFVRLMEQW